MYEQFFGLQYKPFGMQPDPAFIYWSHEHQMAYSMLEYGILNSVGFTVITGEIGSGKTTMLRHLLNQVGDEAEVGLLSNTIFNEGELLQWVMHAFGLNPEGLSKIALFSAFEKYLIENLAKRRRVILVVDEAQNLTARNLEELRMLSNINADGNTLLQTILLGQPQLREILQRPELVQFSQRIGSEFHIDRLQAGEVELYITHRLHIAGAEVPLFSKSASHLVATASHGIPRLVNLICETALVYAFAAKEKVISRETISEVLRDKRKFGFALHRVK